MTRLDTLARRAASDLQSEVESVPVPRVDFRRIRERQIRRTTWTSVLAVAAVVVVVGVPIWLGSFPPEESVAPATSVPPAEDPTLFLGTWATTEIEGFGKAATLVIEASEDDSAEVTMHNRFSVCSDAPSTMTGTGPLQGGSSLVIPAPVITCDDGSQLEVPPGQFQNVTFTHDSSTDILTDNFGGVWIREGAEERGPESNTPHSETEIIELLNAFLESRVAREAAQRYLNGPAEGIPLLYATSSGTPYERGEFEQVSGVEWSYGDRGFRVRLFAGDTVVEQIFTMGSAGRLGLSYPGSFGTGGDLAPTTENGRPVAEAHDLYDGAVTLHVAHPWVGTTGDRILLIPAGEGPTTDGGQRHGWDVAVPVVDPKFGCQTHPDAAALAESIRSYPGFETTAPVAVSGGGAEGVMMDVVIHDIATACDDFGGRFTPGHRMRLYLFDAPQGLSMRILAIPLVVPVSEFERAVEATAPIAVDFHTP